MNRATIHACSTHKSVGCRACEKAAGRILRLVHPESGGPRQRRLLDAIAGDCGGIVDDLIQRGRLVKYGDRKGAKWGLPR